MSTGKLYKKICAALLLLCLLLTTTVQLTHTHAAAKASSTKAIKVDDGKDYYSVSNADATCFLCEYQLTKDADLSFSIFQSNTTIKVVVKPTLYTEQLHVLFNNDFESRGPPAFVFAA